MKQFMKEPEDRVTKMLKSGNLPDYYPSKQRQQAQLMKKEKALKGDVMKYITEPYRFCIFPPFTPNIMTICDLSFKSSSEKRPGDCKYTNCVACCHQLVPITKMMIKFNKPFTEKLGFSEGKQLQGMLEFFQDANQREQCARKCKKEYPVEGAFQMPEPKKDEKLGKGPENPALSCVDVLQQGIKESGKFYIKYGKKAVQQLYCDLKTEGGGWTLFFSYRHRPFADVKLDQTKPPNDPNFGTSHMRLKDLGVNPAEVSELRFVCASKHEHRFIHFTSRNSKLLKIAFTGDQEGLKEKDFKFEKKVLKEPKFEGFGNLIQATLPETVSEDGGFWDSPFGNQDGYWTVKGKARVNGRWECGDVLSDEKGSDYETIHQIWFRGPPPSKEALEKRELEKMPSPAQ